MHEFRSYTFLGATKSLCPDCEELVDAKIISRGPRVYFRKSCPEHGVREDFVCSDRSQFDRNDYSFPGKLPTQFGAEVKKGCPYDCGLCEEHEQHTCIGLLEITSSCNLECPICFAQSGPGGKHLQYEQVVSAIDRLVEVETQPEVLQLSGGEPTIHPDFEQILRYACSQPIDVVMINTNGIRIARDQKFNELLAQYQKRCEIYFQFDTFEDAATLQLRGQSLVETKLKAIENLGKLGIRTTLVCTVQAGVNESQIGKIVEFALPRPWITGVSFQPASYTGRYFLPEELEERITFPDIQRMLEEQTSGRLKADDFSPLPCAHPNGHSLAYVFRQPAQGEALSDVSFLPLSRFIDFSSNLELLAGRITFNRPRASELVQSYLDRLRCGSQTCTPEGMLQEFGGVKALLAGKGRADVLSEHEQSLAQDFLLRAVTQNLDQEHMLRLTTTSFMDAYNFDIRQLMKSCVHQVLPSGHLIPFSAYNLFYRNGKVPLPSLKTSSTKPQLVSLNDASSV